MPCHERVFSAWQGFITTMLSSLTEEKIRAFLADAEITAFDNAGAEGTLPQRMQKLILSVCSMVSGYVNASGRYPYLQPGTPCVPEELEHCALVLVRHAMMADLPDMSSLEGGIRAREYNAALDVFKAVAEGNFYLSDYYTSGEQSTTEVLAAGREPQPWASL